jgi:hypothetical protein
MSSARMRLWFRQRPYAGRTRMKSAAAVAKFVHSGKIASPVASLCIANPSAALGGTHKIQVCRNSSASVGQPRHAHSGRITLPNPAFERTRVSVVGMRLTFSVCGCLRARRSTPRWASLLRSGQRVEH